MAMLKLTKNELRTQQNRLNLLFKYLPTLQLKKSLLQLEVSEARTEIAACEDEYNALKIKVDAFSPVLTDRLPFDIHAAVNVKEIRKRFENIAGVEIPYFESVVFDPCEYALFDTPAWVDVAVIQLRALRSAQIKLHIAQREKE